MYRRHRYLFWLNTGELPETLDQLVSDVTPELRRRNREGNLRQRQRRGKLNLKNQVLLVMIWLRKYPYLDSLALLFDISIQTVSAIIYHVIPVLWRYFQSQVTWPTLAEWNAMRRAWPMFPNAVGCIDGTPHKIYRPEQEPQREFYSGHRHFHLMSTQIITDNENNIRFLQAGFVGSMVDSTTYRLMTPVGPGKALDLPPGVVLLADQGYSDTDPLLTPFRQQQIRAMRPMQRQRAREFNTGLSHYRVSVEHAIKHVKTYKAVVTHAGSNPLLLSCVHF